MKDLNFPAILDTMCPFRTVCAGHHLFDYGFVGGIKVRLREISLGSFPFGLSITKLTE